MLRACLAAKCGACLLLDMYANVCTGTNPQGLLRTVVWKGIWSLENFLQCIGRTARMHGQTGIIETIVSCIHARLLLCAPTRAHYAYLKVQPN
jgi:hypothetical protein